MSVGPTSEIPVHSLMMDCLPLERGYSVCNREIIISPSTNPEQITTVVIKSENSYVKLRKIHVYRKTQIIERQGSSFQLKEWYSFGLGFFSLMISKNELRESLIQSYSSIPLLVSKILARMKNIRPNTSVQPLLSLEQIKGLKQVLQGRKLTVIMSCSGSLLVVSSRQIGEEGSIKIVKEMIPLENLRDPFIDSIGIPFVFAKAKKTVIQKAFYNRLLLKEAIISTKLRSAKVPFVVTIYQGIRSSVEKAGLFMEECSCSLYQFMKDIWDVCRDTPEALPGESKKIVLQAAEGFSAMHRYGYVHGDIKITNILVKKTGTGVEARIIDFGNTQKASDRCSSLGTFIPPECLKDLETQTFTKQRTILFSPQIDDWAFGVILLFVAHPSLYNSDALYYSRPSKTCISYLCSVFAKLNQSNPIDNAIKGLLEPDPTHRMSIEEAAKHII